MVLSRERLAGELTNPIRARRSFGAHRLWCRFAERGVFRAWSHERRSPSRAAARRPTAGLGVLLAVGLSACKTEILHELVDYATTPCPFGAHYVVSGESGTPGLRKLTEKWCEVKDEHGERIRHGPYFELYDSGAKKEVGQYQYGRREGTWKRWHANGRMDSISVYQDGKPQSFVGWHDNGQKWEEGRFDNGFKHGLWIRWHSNGQKEVETYYEHGTLERSYTVWHDNGQKQQQGEYKKGEREGLWTQWHANGQKRSEILFHAGKPDNWYRAWHENGQQAEQALFHDGKPEGSYTLWHDNGQKEEEGSYHDGRLDGQVTAWDRDGHVWMKTEYRGGSLVEDASDSAKEAPGPAEPPSASLK